MNVFRTRSSQPNSKVSKVKLRLELARKELDIVFPVGKDKDHVLYEQHPHFRPEYRFRISSDQHFRVFRVDEADRRVSFIISLKIPPPYTKKDHAEVENSHQSDGKWWDENAVWLRQTNIISQSKDMDKVTARPLALNGNENAINVGRWTAYRIVFDLRTVNANDLRIMTEALQDFFDVKVEHLPKMTYSKPTSTVWDVLDEHAKADLSNLHPIILPFTVRYMLEVCISNGRLHEYDVPELFLRRLQEAGETKSMHHLKHILDLNNEKAERILFDPMSSYDASQYLPKLRKEPKLPNGCALIYSATVTATTIIFNAPSVEITNRIIRQHSQHFDRFLRVRFEDDKYRGDSRIYAQTTNKLDALFKRVRRTLTHGIILGDRHYEFLAWGNSQLREHGAYFFAKLPGVMSASKIRAEMGEFKHEKVIAKHAARMGQCFSTTKAVGYRVPLDSTTTLIDDVKRGKYNFTDGVGQISQLLAQLVNGELKLAKTAPSAFQFRLGGCKGVLAVHKGLQSINIGLRHSQQKFQSTARILEIIRHSAKSDAHLNRQLILVLSALGVGDEVFNNMIAREIGALDEAMENGAVARKELSRSIDENAMTPEISRLVEQGFHDIREPFVTNVLQLWRAWRLKYLKEKAKLHIPNGACLLGCTDETGTLQGHFENSGLDPHSTYQEQYKHLPQVFVQVRRRAGADDARNEDDVPYEVIEGLCWIARNPSLHEGDIRVVKAVNVPALSHLRDVLVLPQTGDQDLSSMCSGGDLDGDDYIVVWAEDKTEKKFDLLPSKWNAKPMDYTPPDAVKASGNNVTQNEVINFFDTYMRSDFLGKIAVAHLGWADAEDDGIRSEKCLKLAQEHSKAVDYPKTGVPAELTTKLQPQKWPHFMERKAGLPYTSYKILGQLYDRVKDLYKVHKVDGLAGEARRGHFHVDYDPNKFDARIITACEPSEIVTEFVKSLKWEYDIHLRRIMAKHEISTEFEVWSTFVLDHSKACSDYKFYEEMGNLSRSLKQQFEEELVLEAKGRNVDALKPYAVAAYRLAQSECKEARDRQEAAEDGVREQMPYISFPWLLHDTLGAIAQSSQSREHADSSAHTDITESGNIAMKNSTRAGATWLHYPDPYQAPPANGSELSSGSQKATKAAALPKLATASVAADRPAQEPGLLHIGSTDQAATSLSSLSDLQGLSLSPTHRLSDDGHYMSPLRRRSTQSGSSGSQLQSRRSSLVPLAREKTEDGNSDDDGEVYDDPAAMER